MRLLRAQQAQRQPLKGQCAEQNRGSSPEISFRDSFQPDNLHTTMSSFSLEQLEQHIGDKSYIDG